MVCKQEVRITPFVSLWSTMTMIESSPSEGGRSVIRLMESCLKGRDYNKGMGTRGGIVG